MEPLIESSEARKRILAHLPTIPEILCPLEKCAGRVLRADLTADRDFPPYNRAMMDGTFRERSRNERPEGLEEARSMLLKLIEEVKEETGLSESRIALGGFSQGAMLTTDVSLQLDENPAGLIVWSGTLLNEEEWRKLGPERKGLKVLQTHGRQDPLLPYDWAENLRDMLREVGLEVEFIPFDGPHTVPEPGVERAIALLEDVLE